MKKTPIILGIVAALALAGAAIVIVSSRHPAAPPREEAPKAAPAPPGKKTLPPFTLADFSGNRVDSSLFRGKPTVVNFFATWGPPCREEIPGFVAVYEKYRTQGLEVVGISLDEDTRGNLAEFIASHRISYRVLLGNVDTVKAFAWGSAIPATFFVGRDGEVKNVHVGFLDRDAFEREVKKIL